MRTNPSGERVVVEVEIESNYTEVKGQAEASAFWVSERWKLVRPRSARSLPPERLRSLLLAGTGINLVRGMVATGPVARALEAPTIEDLTNDTARSFRAFAEKTGSDLAALAACLRGPREKIGPEDLARIAVPTLVATGSEDVIAGSGEALRELIPNAQLLDIEGRDHMKAVGDPRFKQGVLDFLTRRA